jgi:Ca2+-binding EF-hand superfamily protein
MRQKLMFGSVAAVVLAGVAIAAIYRPGVSTPSTDDTLLEGLRPGATIEQYTAQVVSELRAADRAGDGLDRADVDLSNRQQLAQQRASAVADMLRLDLDGDFKVTRSELELSMRGEDPYRTRQMDLLLDRLDGNGDGIITLPEAAASAAGSPYRGQRLEALLALDPNKDGRLTAQELRHLAEKAFASVDRDGDGKLSREEFTPVADRARAAMQDRMTPVCKMPPLPSGAKLVAYSAYEGAAIASVAIGGPDQETNLTVVEIEPGSAPLYLVLSSNESMLWRLTGSTGRVARVVVSSAHTGRLRNVANVPSPPVVRRDRFPVTSMASPGGVPSASGVVGIAADRVTIEPGNCPPYASNSNDGPGAKAATAPIRRALGRDPDVFVTTYSTARVGLPSGRLSKAGHALPPLPRGFDPGMWREAARYWPAGLVAVDPRQVVAGLKVEPYQVLPSQMGLAQLIGAGAMERTSDGKFRLVRPIAHMPPSMGGAHSVSIVLGNGVPMPPGDPVHSCVMPEANWKRLRPGERCEPKQPSMSSVID